MISSQILSKLNKIGSEISGLTIKLNLNHIKTSFMLR